MKEESAVIRKAKKVPRLLYLGLAALAVMISFAAFLYKTSIDDKSDQISTAQNEISVLKEQNKSLEDGLNEARSEIESLEDVIAQEEDTEEPVKEQPAEDTNEEPDFLTLEVEEAFKDSRGYVHNNPDRQHILFDLSVTNNSDDSIYFATGDLKLKDSEGQSYNPDTSQCWSNWSDTIDKVLIKAQMVKAGENLRGSICFSNLSVFLTGLELHYYDSVIGVTLVDATYPVPY